MIGSLLEHYTRDKQARTIRRHPSIEPPYLSRWYLRGLPRMPDGSFPFDNCGRPRRGSSEDKPPSVWLHKFGQSDDDDYHNHPWAWAVSIILSVGYIEHRLNLRTKKETSRVLTPGSINFIRHGDFHRIELIGNQPAWSLFLPGPRVSEWGFFHMQTGRYYGWEKYWELVISQKNGRHL